MAITVGINKNVRLVSAVRNDKGTLVLTFGQGKSLSEVDTDDLLSAVVPVKDRSTTNIMLWPLTAEQGGTPRESDRIGKDIASLRDQLEEVLRGYLTLDQAKLDAFAGITGLAKENIAQKITDQAILDKIYDNLANQFVAKFNSLGELKDKEFRLLLIRKSATNHYGTFRKNFIKDNPFYEDMGVPEEQSKVKFTNYEKEKGWDNPEKVAAQADVATDAQSTTDDILGLR